MGARLKFWRLSRVPKKGIRNKAVDGYAVKSHSTILQRLRRQISLDYYTIAVVTLQTFYLGKHDLLTVYLGKLDFLSVTDFSLGNLPRGNFIV